MASCRSSIYIYELVAAASQKTAQVNVGMMVSRARGRYILAQWLLLRKHMHLRLWLCVYEIVRESSCLSGYGESISLPKRAEAKQCDET